MKTFHKIFIILILSFFLIAFFIPISIFASEIIFQNPDKILGAGDEFSVPILLFSEGESVNAISGDIVWNDDILSAVNVFSANSIVNSWVEIPRISGNSIVFSGVMIGGFETVIDPISQKSGPGTIVTAVFRVKKEGIGKIEFSDAHLYKNDGLGTEKLIQNDPLVLSFSPRGSALKFSIDDVNPPEIFIPIITRDLDIFNGQIIIIFNTTDKETGIDHYEVKQGNGEWVRAESPFLLTDQKFYGMVFVKAIDLAGNYRIESVQLKQKISALLFFIHLFVVIIIIVFLYFIFLKRAKRHINDHIEKSRKISLD